MLEKKKVSRDTFIFLLVGRAANLFMSDTMATDALNHLFTNNVTVALPILGLGLSTISKPLTSRAQFSCSRAAHGTVREIVWMKPAVTSKGASAVSRSSLRDCGTR